MGWINEIFQESHWKKQDVSKGFKYIHEQFGMIVGGKLDENGKPDLLNFTFFFK